MEMQVAVWRAGPLASIFVTDGLRELGDVFHARGLDMQVTPLSLQR
jgi:hypothetical protein